MDYGFIENENIDGMFEFDGTFACKLHPSQITVSETGVKFDYNIGGKAVSRSYTLTKSDGKITSVTAPDGASAEVIHNG